MPTYRVSRLLDSAAYLPTPVSVRGVTFEHPDPTSSRLLGWADSTASDWHTALTDVDIRILQLADAIVACQLAAISTYGSPTLVQKAGEDTACLIWREQTEDRWHVNTFQDGVISDIEMAERGLTQDLGLASAARHFRESLLERSALGSAMQVLRSAEALVPGTGRGFTCRSCHADPLLCAQCGTAVSTVGTNKSGLQDLMGENLHDYFYRTGGRRKRGVRNDLMHGHIVDQEELQEQARLLREIVQKTLAERLQITTQPHIRARGLFSYRGSRYWIRAPAMPSLLVLEERVKNDAINHYSTPELLASNETAAIDASY